MLFLGMGTRTDKCRSRNLAGRPRCPMKCIRARNRCGRYPTNDQIASKLIGISDDDLLIWPATYLDIGFEHLNPRGVF